MTSPGDSIPDIMIVNNDECIEMERSNFISPGVTPNERTPLVDFFDISYNTDDSYYQSTSLTNSLVSTFDSRIGKVNNSSTSSFCTSTTLMHRDSGHQALSSKQLPNGQSGAMSSDSTTSFALHSSMLTTFTEDVCIERSSTVLSTVFNILPLLQGTPIFAIPFAFITEEFVLYRLRWYCVFLLISAVSYWSLVYMLILHVTAIRNVSITAYMALLIHVWVHFGVMLCIPLLSFT